MLTIDIVLNVASALEVFAIHSCISTLASHMRNVHYFKAHHQPQKR
jgi:hypothetical protein